VKLIKLTTSEVITMLSAVFWLTSQTAANAAQAPPLRAAQIQQITGGLVRTDSQDFFERGREKLEREIQNLQQQRQPASKPLLNINEVLIEKDSIPTTKSPSEN